MGIRQEHISIKSIRENDRDSRLGRCGLLFILIRIIMNLIKKNKKKV